MKKTNIYRMVWVFSVKATALKKQLETQMFRSSDVKLNAIAAKTSHDRFVQRLAAKDWLRWFCRNKKNVFWSSWF